MLRERLRSVSCHFSCMKRRIFVVVLLSSLCNSALAGSYQVKSTKIGQAGWGNGSLASAPAWIQQQHPGGLYFPMHHKSKLLLAHREADPDAWGHTDQERDRRLQGALGSPQVSWDLNGEGGEPPFLYYTSVILGDNQQPFNVIIDTGSSLLWVQCECLECANQSSSSSPVILNEPLRVTTDEDVAKCGSELCVSLAQEAPSRFGCPANATNINPPCAYVVRYLDGTFSQGVVLTENITLVLSSGEIVQPPVVVGCGRQQSESLNTGPTVFDGLMGLGRSSYAVLETLSARGIIDNSFSVCLEGEGQGGHMLLGRSSLSEGAVYTPLPTNSSYANAWSAKLLSVTVNGTTITPESGSLEVILDTGSSKTLLPRAFHTAIFSAMIPVLFRSEADFGRIPNNTCLSVAGVASILEIAQLLPTIVVNFENAAGSGQPATMEIPVFNFLSLAGYDTDASGAQVSVFCLDSFGVDAADSGTLVGFDQAVVSILGASWIRNFDILYDHVNQRIGWVPLNCTTGASLDALGSQGRIVVTYPPATNPPADGTFTFPSPASPGVRLPPPPPAARFSPPPTGVNFSIGPPAGGGSTPPPTGARTSGSAGVPVRWSSVVCTGWAIFIFAALSL